MAPARRRVDPGGALRRALGGLGLSTQEAGAIYGTAGTAAFLVGSILGGWFTSRVGLARAMPTLILAMNVPNLVAWYLGTAQPSDLGLVTAALSAEMFGYGFGFVGMILFIMQVIAPARTRRRTTGWGPDSCSSASCCPRWSAATSRPGSATGIFSSGSCCRRCPSSCWPVS
jgi:hypothetical protein